MTLTNSFRFYTKNSGAKEKDYPLLAMAHSSSILPKYLTILYRNVHLRNRPHPWSNILGTEYYRKATPHNSPSKIKSHRKISGISSSILSYQGICMDTGFKKKTSKIVGIMLNGEINVQPENLYELYKLELFDKNNSIPDESCLSVFN